MSKTNKCSPEVRERAVRVMQEHCREYPSLWAAIESSTQDGCVAQTLNEWVKRDEIGAGQRAGVTTTDLQGLTELERENKALRRPDEILKPASAFGRSRRGELASLPELHALSPVP